MATTPEGKIKRKLTTMLRDMGVWYFFPSAGPMGRSGIPDVICIVYGMFVGIECKADLTKKATPLQARIGMEIRDAGGRWFLVRSDHDIEVVRQFIESRKFIKEFIHDREY